MGQREVCNFLERNPGWHETKEIVEGMRQGYKGVQVALANAARASWPSPLPRGFLADILFRPLKMPAPERIAILSPCGFQPPFLAHFVFRSLVFQISGAIKHAPAEDHDKIVAEYVEENGLERGWW